MTQEFGAQLKKIYIYNCQETAGGEIVNIAGGDYDDFMMMVTICFLV